MAAFVSQFGAVLLGVQEELRRSVDRAKGMPRAANMVIVSVDRETFIREQGGNEPAAVERFREELRREIDLFLESNEWSLGAPLSLNILLRALDIPCRVRAEHRPVLYRLAIRDDAGERDVPVNRPVAVLGREHPAPPRDFISVRDASRSLSREHLLLTFRDLALHAILRGANPTTLNREPMRPDADVLLRAGDTVRCGAHTIRVTEIAGGDNVGPENRREEELPG